MIPSNAWDANKAQLFLLKSLSFVILLASFSLLFRPDVQITHRPIVEDGYYALSVASNIASGNGVTIDGVHRTNGFQPLFTFLSVPAFLLAGGNHFMAIRYILFIHWVVCFLTAFLLARIAADIIEPNSRFSHSKTFWWVFFIFVSNTLVFIVNFNGLETGFLLFLYASAWRYYQKTGIEHWPQVIIFAAILGLLVLARIDAVFFVITFSFFYLGSKSETLVHRLEKSAALGAISLIVSSPWWIFNYINFGSFLPTSGKAYQSWITFGTLFEPASLGRIRDAFMALTRVMMPIVYLGQNTFEGLAVAFVRTCLICITGFLLWHRRKNIKLFVNAADANSLVSTYTTRFAMIFITACIILIGSYVLTFSATWFFTRYFSPLLLISLFILGMFFSQVRLKHSKLTNIAAIGLVLPLSIVIILLHMGSFQSDFINNQIYLVQNRVPQTSKVAAFQTGTLGFFRSDVVNLDGKVNPDAVTHRAHLLEYVQSNKIEWLCDEQSSILNILGEKNLQSNGWKLIETKGQFALFHKETAF